MKVTNVSNKLLYLADLKFVPQAQAEGRPNEGRYLAPGASVYFPNTSQVLRSASVGTIAKWRDAGYVTLEDVVTLAANGNPGDSVTLPHPFSFGPTVYVLKQVGPAWVDATGTYDLVHNMTSGLPMHFESVTITNTTVGSLTFYIRFL